MIEYVTSEQIVASSTVVENKRPQMLTILFPQIHQ